MFYHFHLRERLAVIELDCLVISMVNYQHLAKTLSEKKCNQFAYQLQFVHTRKVIGIM